MKIKLFTHTDLDGVGCAILAYLAFGRKNVEVEYCDYSNVDDKVGDFIKNKALYDSYDWCYITDISMSDAVADMIDKVNKAYIKVRLFDHHITALRLNKYKWCSVTEYLDAAHTVKTSGTELFYLYLKNKLRFTNDLTRMSGISKFVNIVRDWDTWRWRELGDNGVVCKQVNDLFYIYGRDKFIEWFLDQLKYYGLKMFFPKFTDIDKALLDQRQKDIDRYVEEKSKQIQNAVDQFGNIHGLIFAERYFSELGNRLCEMHPEYAYIAMIDVAHGTVSYRTIREGIDLGGEIAHAYGGGGHKKAAGSTFDSKLAMDKITNIIFSEGNEL